MLDREYAWAQAKKDVGIYCLQSQIYQGKIIDEQT